MNKYPPSVLCIISCQGQRREQEDLFVLYFCGTTVEGAIRRRWSTIPKEERLHVRKFLFQVNMPECVRLKKKESTTRNEGRNASQGCVTNTRKACMYDVLLLNLFSIDSRERSVRRKNEIGTERQKRPLLDKMGKQLKATMLVGTFCDKCVGGDCSSRMQADRAA